MKTRVNKHVMFSNYIKAHVLVYFLQLVLTFTPPLHHNGKGSIDITIFRLKMIHFYSVYYRGIPMRLISV